MLRKISNEQYRMGFLDKRKEYIIENMYPKRPWMNYLWNEHYIAIINQFGFGKGMFEAENNFQRNIVKETDSRIIYIKENDEVFAANRNYDDCAFEKFETVVGMGYSKVISEYKNILSELKIFVPETGRRECWELRLTNTSDAEKTFDVYAYADIDVRITEHLSCSIGDFHKELNGVLYRHNAYGSPTSYHVVYFASDEPPVAYDTSKRSFVGVYGNLLRPDGIKEECLASVGNSFDADTLAVLQFQVSLKAKESKELLFVLGVEKSEDKAVESAGHALSKAFFSSELLKLKEKSEIYDDVISVETPDEEVDRFANIWLKRQMELGKTWGRVYNKGFRDIMQDISGFLQLDPLVAREKILDCVQYQKEDGNTLRSWVPIDRRPYRDGATWLLSTIAAYTKETADTGILEETTGYFESDIKETVLEHCIRGIEFLYREVGEHGLCLWGGGDWNDSFDGAGLNGIGESVWLSIATVKATNDFLEMLIWLGKKELAELYTNKRDKMIKNIQESGWDKDHYIYGITDWQERVGSYETKEGRIFLNPQTWAVLAGIAADNDALMDMVEKELGCDFGYVQQKPCYTVPNPHVGRISYFGKGFYENGSVYNHGVAFKLVADCAAGRNEQAYATLKKLLPSNPTNHYEKSGVEPYALCNMFFGPENETRAGEAPMYWITGTSSWIFRGIVEYIIGVRADYDGLIVDPKLPNCWGKVKIRRKFRGVCYNIEIVRTGNKAVAIDGKIVGTDRIPVLENKKECDVFVEC